MIVSCLYKPESKNKSLEAKIHLCTSIFRCIIWPLPCFYICLPSLLPANENVAVGTQLHIRGSLTGRVSTGKALTALHDHIWVTAAAQLKVHVTIWETAIEEVWPRPDGSDRGITEDTFRLPSTISLADITTCDVVYSVYLPTTSLMTLVKTPFSTRVRVTAGRQGETELNHEKRQGNSKS